MTLDLESLLEKENASNVARRVISKEIALNFTAQDQEVTTETELKTGIEVAIEGEMTEEIQEESIVEATQVQEAHLEEMKREEEVQEVLLKEVIEL